MSTPDEERVARELIQAVRQNRQVRIVGQGVQVQTDNAGLVDLGVGQPVEVRRQIVRDRRRSGSSPVTVCAPRPIIPCGTNTSISTGTLALDLDGLSGVAHQVTFGGTTWYLREIPGPVECSSGTDDDFEQLPVVSLITPQIRQEFIENRRNFSYQLTISAAGFGGANFRASSIVSPGLNELRRGVSSMFFRPFSRDELDDLFKSPFVSREGTYFKGFSTYCPGSPDSNFPEVSFIVTSNTGETSPLRLTAPSFFCSPSQGGIDDDDCVETSIAISYLALAINDEFTLVDDATARVCGSPSRLVADRYNAEDELNFGKFPVFREYQLIPGANAFRTDTYIGNKTGAAALVELAETVVPGMNSSNSDAGFVSEVRTIEGVPVVQSRETSSGYTIIMGSLDLDAILETNKADIDSLEGIKSFVSAPQTGGQSGASVIRCGISQSIPAGGCFRFTLIQAFGLSMAEAEAAWLSAVLNIS